MAKFNTSQCRPAKIHNQIIGVLTQNTENPNRISTEPLQIKNKKQTNRKSARNIKQFYNKH